MYSNMLDFSGCHVVSQTSHQCDETRPVPDVHVQMLEHLSAKIKLFHSRYIIVSSDPGITDYYVDVHYMLNIFVK